MGYIMMVGMISAVQRNQIQCSFTSNSFKILMICIKIERQRKTEGNSIYFFYENITDAKRLRPTNGFFHFAEKPDFILLLLPFKMLWSEKPAIEFIVCKTIAFRSFPFYQFKSFFLRICSKIIASQKFQ